MTNELYDYPLSPDSVVFDVGGYGGGWTEALVQYLGFSPQIHIFEPVAKFRSSIPAKLSAQIFSFGLGDRNEQMQFALEGDRTGFWSQSTKTEIVEIRDINEVLAELEIKSLDLISINCEGGEYALLDRVLGAGIASYCKYIQVQYHNLFPEASERRDQIREKLALTHKERYNFPWLWEGWEKK